MSLSLSLSHIIHMFLLISIYVISFPPINLPSSLNDSPIFWDASPAPLQVYQCRSQPIDIPVWEPSSTDNDIVVFDPSPNHLSYLIQSPLKLINLLLFRKGICSTYNPSPHHTNISYCQLIIIDYTCLSSLSFVPILKSPGESLYHNELR